MKAGETIENNLIMFDIANVSRLVRQVFEDLAPHPGHEQQTGFQHLSYFR